jgi:hypothetical protein
MRYLSTRKYWNMFDQTVGNRPVVHMVLRSALYRSDPDSDAQEQKETRSDPKRL